MKISKVSLLVMTMLGVSSLRVGAVEYVDAIENIPKSVEISSKELTRISIENGGIINVKYVEGEIDYQTQNGGQMYLRPLVKKPINIFITSNNNRSYLLSLKPSSKKGADSIIIREGAKLQAEQFENQKKLLEEERVLQRNSSNYTAAVQEFISSMASNNDINDISCSPAGDEVPLWNEALLIRKERCSTSNLQGQIFSVTNVSKSVMVLAEQEFYKRNVIAVAIRQLELQPGEQTDVFVVFGDQ